MLISLIIPVYNVESYLEETLRSVVCQTFSDYEVILVDDGSVDGSGRICDKYAAEYGNFTVLHKENGGQSSARNMGIRAARGEFLAFLDSDDFICDKDYFLQVSEKMTGDTDAVMFRYYKYESPDKIRDCGISMAGLDGLGKHDMLYELVRRDAFFCSCWSKCVRRSLILENNLFFDESLSCEDMDWFLAVVEKIREIAVVDKPFVCYRQRPNSVTSTFRTDSIVGFVDTIEKWEKRLKEQEDERLGEILLSALAKLYCNLLISYTRHRRELKHLEQKIFSFCPLLRYHLNPRARKIWLCESVIGIRGTCFLIGLVDKIR